MKKLCVFIGAMLCMLLITTESKSQSADSLRSRYQQQTLQFIRGYAALGENGERIPRRELRNYFTISPEGLPEYDAAQKKMRTARTLVWSSLAFIAGSAILRKDNKTLSYVSLGIAQGLLIASIPIGFNGGKKFSRAVWLRNRDAVFGPGAH
jgi:hypothetical protein